MWLIKKTTRGRITVTMANDRDATVIVFLGGCARARFRVKRTFL